MNNKIYSIILADGTEIANLRLNGNNYISNDVINENIFDGNCSPVVINDGTNSVTHDNMELIQVTEMDGKHWLILRDLSADELERIKMQSDIEYVAMIAGAEL